MSQQNFRKFRKIIIAVMLSFSIVPLLVLGYTIYHQFQVSYTKKIYEDMKKSVENRKQAIDIFLEERVSQLMTLAYSHSYAKITDQEYIQQLFNFIQGRSKYYVDIGVIDEYGNHVAYHGPFKLLGVNYRETEWFKNVFAKGVYISDVFKGFRNVPHFIIAVLKYEQGKPWILRATIDSDIFEKLVKAAWTGRTGNAYVLNKEGVYQTTPRLEGVLLQKKENIDPTHLGDIHMNAELVTGGNNLVTAVSRLNTKDWILVLEQNPVEELAPLFHTRKLTVILGCAGLLFIISGVLLASWLMVQQLIRSEREKAALDATLIQSSKLAALGKLAAGIAHEINNPLSVILEKAGWIKDLLEEEDIKASKNFQEFDKAVSKIEEHVERARKVTHRLLGFARKMEPINESVDLHKVLDETLSFLESEFRHKEVTLKREYAQDLPTIKSDPAQLQQVFLNILENAVDAVERGGVVWVTTSSSPKEGTVCVEIADDGPGIPDNEKKRIFDPFYTTKPVGSGTGLGLSVCYNIIQRLGGAIDVKDNWPKGALFRVILPVQREEI